ncbi:MAG: helix-turn-helix transcriptional regulator [Muribaculaceae bacterium]|nr:helix-turn-helix transcriptional regulator [Muribaculaceae bacterium]
MTYTIDAYIILNDTIQSVGLKHLLHKFFNIEASIIEHISNAEIYESSTPTIYITSPDTYILNQDFFIPRRTRTIIITNTTSDDTNVINATDDESTIIERLNAIIHTLSMPDDEKRQNTLSQREIDVLRLVAMGYINKEIADMLSISFNTVLTHRKNITAKLGIKSVSGLGFYAIMNGYISESDLKL